MRAKVCSRRHVPLAVHAFHTSATPPAHRKGVSRKAIMTPDPRETTVAADVGGTHMRAALVNRDGEILYRQVLMTEHNSGLPTELIDLIRSVIDRVARPGDADPDVIMGLPGQIDYRSGKLLWAPNLPHSWQDDLTEDALSKLIGLPVRLANDADIAAVGEAHLGAGRAYKDVAYVTISTGVGGGVVFNGKLVHGDRSIAELGRTIVDVSAWQRNEPSSLEELASGTGLTRMAIEAGLGPLTGEDIAARVLAGDAETTRIWDHATAAAAAGIHSVIDTFAPEVVVLGGGLGLQEQFYKGICAMLEDRATPQLVRVPVVLAALGDNAGLVGASRWIQATQP